MFHTFDNPFFPFRQRVDRLHSFHQYYLVRMLQYPNLFAKRTFPFPSTFLLRSAACLRW